MQKFKNRWQIQYNWQLFFPILGIIVLMYSAYKLADIFFNKHETSNMPYLILTALVFYFLLLKFFLYCFKKLEHKWVVQFKWEMIRIFLVFAFTGSSSVFIGKPIMKAIGITKENLNVIVYWLLYVIIGLVFYQMLLVAFGWLFGQFQFFWQFEKKILKRIGFGKFLKE
jgi:ABC-type Co2+ transport system permease subunit